MTKGAGMMYQDVLHDFETHSPKHLVRQNNNWVLTHILLKEKTEKKYTAQ